MRPMFDFVKQILLKVSFDKELFRKELKKNLQLVKPNERGLLYTWCIATFATDAYREVIAEVFKAYGIY